MSRLAEIAKGIGKFELGVNEAKTLVNPDVLGSRKSKTAVDLGIRYVLSALELSALYQKARGKELPLAQILATSEALKVATHYTFEGLQRWFEYDLNRMRERYRQRQD